MANKGIITEELISLLQEEQNGIGLSTIQLLLPGSEHYAKRRKLRDGALGFDHIKPAAIAVPRNGSEVARVIRWVKNAGLGFTIRGGGNDFWARSIAQDAVVIDMRDINSVEVADDRQTAVIGGGILHRDLTIALDKVGLMTPAANTWIIGYTGWMSNGGYGPSTHLYGMGIEQVIGAELVNADGEQVVANEEMLEGIRGICGHLGVITSLTIKVYPKYDLAQKPLGGMLVFESTDIRGTIKAYLEAAPMLPYPEQLTVHHFIGFQPQFGVVFSVMWTWTGPDVEKGRAVLQTWKDNSPPLLMSTVDVLPDKVRQEQMPSPLPMGGGQRNCFLARLPTAEPDDALTETIIDAAESMPKTLGPNIAWGGMVDIDSTKMPPNCFVDRNHSYFSCSYQYPSEEYAEETSSWSKSLIEKLRSLGKDTVLERGYPATNPPGEKTAEDLYGEKWKRVKEIKMKFDPRNVFNHAYPNFNLG
ncbi:d-lactate dehydrogenase [Colletotrichum truncatum]|uniref:D-lactate dehydrogenase n=1 Tax=Colletotrichum truncatum TaxID=5467 RepID=A0ACC3YJI1_COLTU